MKKMIVVVALALTAVLVQACSNFCNTASSFSLTSKWGSCDAGAGITFTDSTCKNTSACQTAYNSCSSGDQTLMNNQLSCMQNLPTCTPGQELTWFNAVAACAPDAGISSACSSAFAAASADGGCK